MLKKLLLSFLSSLIVLFSFAPYLEVGAQVINGVPVGETNAPANTNATAPAQSGTWYNPTFSQWYSKVYDPNVSPTNEIFGERYTAAQVQWVVYGFVALLINLSGESGTQAVACLMSGNLDSCGTAIQKAIDDIKLSDNGASNWADAFSADRISGIGYVKDKINNFHLIPEVKAQGLGYTAASPVQALWTAIRNLAFGLIILVVIVMAFMIMFRVKVSPQTAITVQSALPKIILALILITFSYAIAGFMIDLMYVVMGILAAFLSASHISSFSTPELFSFLNTSDVFLLLINYLFYFTIGVVIAFYSTAGPGGFVIGFVLATIIFFVLLVVLLISWFKIIWLLLKTFVNILLQIAFAPILILIGTISPIGGFGGWLKELAANLMVYPTVGFLFVIAFFFLAQAYGIYLQSNPLTSFITSNFPFRINPAVLGTTNSWSPPLTVGAKGLSLLWLGASFAVMALIPKTADIIKGLITGKPFTYGTAIGEAAAPLGTIGLGAVNRESARQQAAYRDYEARLARDKNAQPNEAFENANRIWAAIRGASGGRVK